MHINYVNVADMFSCLLQICGRIFSYREQPLISSMLECDTNGTRRYLNCHL